MKTINTLKTGLERSLRSWKGILIVWIYYFIFVSLIVIPIRSSMKAGFGKSMITEKLLDGLNLDIISDLTAFSGGLLTSFSTGLLLCILAGIVVNAFLSGGMFYCVKPHKEKFSSAEFFRASAKYFWSYLIIALIISILIILVTLFILIIPVSLIANMEPGSERAVFLIGLIPGSLFLTAIFILMLIADYARAWNVAGNEISLFRGIGFGFSRTFGNFRSSLLFIIVIVILQLLLVSFVIWFTGAWKPVTGRGLFLLFIVSQLFVILRIMIRFWRYAGVTHLMEQGMIKPAGFTDQFNT